MDELGGRLEAIAAELKNETASLRTGRASPALVENLPVEAYGSRQPLKAVAAISAPEPRQLLIQPWDKTLVAAIERAVQSSALGLSPVVDRDAVRIALPQLTAERKRDLIRALGEKLEAARIHIRQARDAAMRGLDARHKTGELSEDEKFRAKDEIENAVAEANRGIEDLGGAKEAEILAG